MLSVLKKLVHPKLTAVLELSDYARTHSQLQRAQSHTQYEGQRAARTRNSIKSLGEGYPCRKKARHS